MKHAHNWKIRNLDGLCAAYSLSETPTRLPQSRIEAGPAGGEISTPPIEPVDTSHPSAVVGTGTVASCTEEALDEAIRIGGVITFDCGGNATIPITSQKELRTDVDTTIDGQGEITLDGNGATRLLSFNNLDYRTNTTTVTLQNLRLINGRAPGTPLCAISHFDCSGGAIYIRDEILHVFRTTFENNHAEQPGPDVGGGAIYGFGSLEVIVVGSQFISNSAVNGGAIGALNADLSVYNSSFDRSATLADGGAIFIDGGSDGMAVFCGDTFTGNRAGENSLGGAIFRTPDFDPQPTIIDQCTFEGNYSLHGGGALYFHNSYLRISKSTFSENGAPSIGGALQADSTVLQVENSTFANNWAGLAWAVAAIFDSQGDFRNCTFVGNDAWFSPIRPDFVGASIENSIFLGNTAAGGGITCDSESPGSGNLQWPPPDGSGPNSLSGCVLGVSVGDPALSELANHGGPTSTFLPGDGSSARGLGSGCPETDQRGWPRADPNACTAGSVEIG